MDDICCPPVKSCPKSCSCVICTSSARRPHEISTPKIFPVKWLKTEKINTSVTSGLILGLDKIRRATRNSLQIYFNISISIQSNDHNQHDPIKVRLEDFMDYPATPYVLSNVVPSSVVRPVAPSMFQPQCYFLRSALCKRLSGCSTSRKNTMDTTKVTPRYEMNQNP